MKSWADGAGAGSLPPAAGTADEMKEDKGSCWQALEPGTCWERANELTVACVSARTAPQSAEEEPFSRCEAAIDNRLVALGVGPRLPFPRKAVQSYFAVSGFRRYCCLCP